LVGDDVGGSSNEGQVGRSADIKVPRFVVSSPSVLQASWPGFLEGAGIDATDAQLPMRVGTL
jgi:hypothetical protein